MRKNIVVGNWKMNLNKFEAVDLVEAILERLLNKDIHVILAPSFVHLSQLVKMSSYTDNVSVASQNCSEFERGAYTGEVSADIIAAYGVQYVILGHSERREMFNENNILLKGKVDQALKSNLDVIFCCGETLKQRKDGIHFKCIEAQINDSLFHLSPQEFSSITIAYEPIWAIGTGMTASADEAQQVHKFIRETLKNKFGRDISQNTSILYGGSCNPNNANLLFAQQDIDGGLIGGASLGADSFLKVINSF
tara:strand:- start:15508 stop:16260 length:753 start_codon:yes stop_codon:yes gene_type:complete